MKLRNKKTSEVYDVLISAYGISGDVAVSVMDGNAKSGYADLGRYKTLAELNEEWEDYEPAGPLIKDENMRKAIRAWAEADGVTKVYAYAIGGGEYTELYAQDDGVTDGRIRISLKTQAGMDWGEDYTIEELCGEEEQCES
jgi:hypothetical protein